jgi:hypothetical protein
MRNFVPRVLAVIGLVWVGWLFSIPAAAQGTPEQRAACQGDALRLCGQYIPDVERITSCMKGNVRYLSPGCRAVFDAGRRRGTRQ